MKNTYDCLFIFWWLESEMQGINQHTSTKIWWSKSDIQYIIQKTSTNNCKVILEYFAEICVLQHTDKTWTKNKQTVLIYV